MTTSRLFLLCSAIFSLTSSQLQNIDEVIVFDQWLAADSTLTALDCKRVGGYDSNNDNIKLYGGQADNTAIDTFTPSDESISDSTGTLSPTVEVAFNQYFSSGNVVYYVSGTEIRSIDLASNSDTLFANRAAASTDPGVCVDATSGTVYTVGDIEIEACTTSGCTAFAQKYLIHADGEVDSTTNTGSLRSMACSVYDGQLFVFGGIRSEGADGTDPSDGIWTCELPLAEHTCTTNTTFGVLSLSAARGAISVAEIDCFNGKYVALIGGATTVSGQGFQVSNVVEIFDLENGRIASMAALPAAMYSFVSAYDATNERIFTFGGIVDSSNTCSNQILVTNTSSMGLCVTSNPTLDPTTEPTKNPSKAPTSDPSKAPSTDPTVAPSKDPTTNPTTANPTATPTTDPTTNPTTDAPTPSPTWKVYVPKDKEQKTSAISYVLIIVILVIICCIICCCFYWYDRNECDEEEDERNQQETGYDRMEQGNSGAAAAGTAKKTSTTGTYHRKPQVPPSSDYGNYVDVIASGGDEKSAVAMTSTAAYNKK